jgi:hypothetical protein
MIRKVGFTGSRSILKFDEKVLTALESITGADLIIHGGATGADKLIQKWADEHHITCEIIRPIDPSNKLDYLFRNVEIVTKSKEIFAVWDGESKGTKFTMDYAKARNKPVMVVR